MNGVATSGNFFQTPERWEKDKGAYEMGLLSPSVPDHEHPALFSSLAKRKRTPVPSLKAQQSKPRPARNYGGRNMRYRWTDQLKPWQVHMLHEADAVASQLDLALNVFVTVNYHGTFPGGGAMASTFKKAVKRMGQWFRDNGFPFAFVYVHENPGDEKPNSHLLVHVPKRLRRAFSARADTWFQALDGGVTVESRNDAGRIAKGLGTRLQYMAKGAPYLVCRNYKGFRAKGGQGPISIKRAGVAQCLLAKPDLMVIDGPRGFTDTRKKGAAGLCETVRDDRFLTANIGGAA